MTSLRLASVPACPGSLYVYLRGEGDRMHVWFLITLTALPTPLLGLLRHPITHSFHHVLQVTSCSTSYITYYRLYPIQYFRLQGYLLG